MAIDGHRPASHPVVQRLALRDAFDDITAPRASILAEAREERDPPVLDDDALVDRLATLTLRLNRPLTVGQRQRLGIIADALTRLSEGGAL